MRWHWKVLIGLCATAASLILWFALRGGIAGPLPIADLKSHVLYMKADKIHPLPPQYWVVLPEKVVGPAKITSQSDGDKTAASRNTQGYLGAEACAECHRGRYETFKETSHHRTSMRPTLETVRGSFEPHRDTLKTSRSKLQFSMESHLDGLYQRVNVNDEGKTYTHAERFDIITGSGTHGQSYLYWKHGGLYQLPVSYFASLNGWVNSPGYTEGTANFSRAIRARCLECHATYFEHQPETMNEYRSDNFILGISCERCHGPGAEHVAFHRAHPGEKHGSHIVQPAMLPVERRHDICRQCHSRSGASLREAFSYRPGEVLSKYLDMTVDEEVAPGTSGIHTANQFARLKMSKCFQQSPQMSCNDCHNPHRNEHGQLALFSERCQKCHQPSQCGMSKTLGKRIERNCIDCHMASRFDASIKVKTATATVSNSMRDHAITVDKSLAEKLVKQGLFDEKGAGSSVPP